MMLKEMTVRTKRTQMNESEKLEEYIHIIWQNSTPLREGGIGIGTGVAIGPGISEYRR